MISGLILFKKNENLDSIFSLNTRDHLSDHWVEMKNFFLRNGINLVTEKNQQQPISFEIHVDVNNKKNTKIPIFLIVWENKYIFPENLRITKLNKYHKIFSHATEAKNFSNANKFFYPVFRTLKVLPNGYFNRKKLLVLIANNKSFPNFNNKYNLYNERVKTIKWFEKHHPNEFYLYGSGWDRSARMPGILGSIISKIEEKLLFKKFKFKSWKGIIDKKDDILTGSRFSIVYENVSGQLDYITEKIFDSFSFGNVPIYWGARNILDYIPKTCFIDRRDFLSHDSLYSFIKNMHEDRFVEYQKNIKNFLHQEKNHLFSIKNFIKRVPSQILSDLKSLNII